jgi:hypothetical protein
MSLPIETIAWIVAGSVAVLGIGAAGIGLSKNKIKKEADNMNKRASDMLDTDRLTHFFGNDRHRSISSNNSHDSLEGLGRGKGKKRKNNTKRHNKNKSKKTKSRK